MTRYRGTLAWLCIGHAVLAGLYWLLLQIPESNAWMLAASGFVILAAVWLTGVIEMTASLALAADAPLRSAFRTVLCRAWMVVFPLALFAAIWWATGEAAAWHARYSGQIDAEIIARTGWTRTSWLHTAVGWLLAFLRWAAGVSLAAALTVALANEGMAGLRPRWMRHALRWKALLATAAAITLGVWLPWQVAYWRPEALPPTWVQPAFAAVKLAVMFVLAQVAWAAILRTAARYLKSGHLTPASSARATHAPAAS